MSTSNIRARPGQVTVARHAGIITKPKTLASILDQAGLTTDELRSFFVRRESAPMPTIRHTIILDPDEEEGLCLGRPDRETAA